MGRSKASANDAAAAAGKFDGEDESVLLKDDGGEPVDSVKVVGQQCIKAAKRSLLHSTPDLGRCKNLRQHLRPRHRRGRTLPLMVLPRACVPSQVQARVAWWHG
jgi:hypothetical protein